MQRIAALPCYSSKALARSFSIVAPKDLTALEDAFRFSIDKHLPASGTGVVFSTAWLATDNIVVHLLDKHFPELLRGLSLLAVDTLHLFDETHQAAAEVQTRYKKAARVYNPLHVSSRAEFEAKYGHAETLNHADFDFYSKVEPYQRGLQELGKEYLITGRRMDQGDKRVALDVWEQQTKTLNPMAEWRWQDVIAFVDKNNVPINRAHNYVFRSGASIDPKLRHKADLPWTKVDLGKPFWRATDTELRGSPPAAATYVFKSFGDVHTSVPVWPHESERAGRFVRYANTECGIHTRVATAGAPHGGKLVDLLARDPAKRYDLASTATRTVDLDERQSCDVELLVNGGFSPLTGFMDKDEYDHVVEHMRLREQQLWAMPIVMDTNDATLKVGERVLLRYRGKPVAVVDVTSVWEPDKAAEAKHVFGTTSLEHPGVKALATEKGRFYYGGPVYGLDKPRREMICLSPAEVRNQLPEGKPVVAFQCRNPIHRAHFELIRRTLQDIPDARVLIHPTCGPTQPDDIEATVRVATYNALASEVANPRIAWAFLPFNMRMAGPREAIQHMIVRKNFGCTHFIIGRDMAGTKSSLTGQDLYGPYDAQRLGQQHAPELAMTVVTYENVVYTEEGYVAESEAQKKGLKPFKLSGTEFRRLLRSGEPIPEWFAFSSVIDALRQHVTQGRKESQA